MALNPQFSNNSIAFGAQGQPGGMVPPVKKRPASPVAGFRQTTPEPELSFEDTINASQGFGNLPNYVSAPETDFMLNSNPEALRMKQLTEQIAGIKAQGVTEAAKPVSLGRKIAGGAAGVATGIFSGFNPMAGYGMYNMVTQAPARAAQAQAQRQASPLEAEFLANKDIAGVKQGFMERQAQIGQSQAAQTQAGNAAQANVLKGNEQQFDRDFPKMQAPTNTGEGVVQTPERLGVLPGGGNSVPVGSSPAAVTAGEYKPDRQGNLFHVMPGQPGQLVKDEAGKPIQMPPEDIKPFNEYMIQWRQANQGAAPAQEVDAIKEYLRAGAVNFGAANIPIGEATRTERAARVAAIAQRISSTLAQNPALNADPNAFKRAMEAELAKMQKAYPTTGGYINEARAEILRSAPTREPKGSTGPSLDSLLPPQQ